MSFYDELKRRNVFRVAVAYIIIAWLILQVGEVLAPALHLPDWVNSALAFFLILGLPVALFFAWAFELTPEGIKKEKQVERDTSITHVTGRKLDFAIIGLLVLALGYFAADKFLLRAPAPEPVVAEAPVAAESENGPTTIAVLPLADMSPGGDHEYFSDGLTEELLNILAKISELQVAGRTSSFAFKGQNEDLREIGRKLNVAHILEGSVRKDEARNKVRITLQLIDADSGYHLWSETYDRDLSDIFAIQEEVAHEVARALRVTLLGEDEARITNVASTGMDAYDLYLQGRRELHRAGYVNLDRAQELFQQVLSLDPAYTPAKLGLIHTWHHMADTGAITVRAMQERGLPLLESLLESDPSSAETLGLMAMYQHIGDNETEADDYFQRALELDPRNARLLKEYGRFLYDNREPERGAELIDAALEIEPYDVDILWDACQTRALMGEFERSIPACHRLQELEPDGPQGYYGEALAHAMQGRLPQTMLGYVRAIQRDPEDYEMLGAMAIFWIALGDSEQARTWLERAEAIGAGQPVPTSARILLYEYNEQYDQAGQLAAQALARDMDNRHGSEFFFRRANAQHAMRTGNLETGLQPYRELLPWLFEDDVDIPPDAVEWTDDLIFVAALLKRSDPLSAKPGVLLTFAERHAAEHDPGWGPLTLPRRLAAVHALRGDHEQAFAHLREAQQYLMQPYWRPLIIESPAFAHLRDTPEFRALMAEAEALAETQRIEARALLEVDS